MPATSPHKPLEIDALIAIRETVGGDYVAYPIADPTLVSFGTESSCLDELRLFLGEHLADLPGTEIHRFVVPEGAELHLIEVQIPRDDLPRRLAQPPPIEIPCAVIPAGKAAWVVALPLEHTFYVAKADTWREKAREEIARIASVREMTPDEYLEILPGLEHRLERLTIQVGKGHRRAGEQAAPDARARSRARRQDEALELLEKIGDPPGPSSRAGLAREISAVERDGLVNTLRTLLTGDERLSVLVTGRELVGKTAAIEAALKQRGRVFVTSGARLMAGQSLFGQWQQRLHEVMEAAELVDAVLYFDNLADLFASRGGAGDMAGILRPFLERGRVRVVAEASPELAEMASRRQVGFFSHLHPVRVEPLSAAATRRVVEAHVAARAKRLPDAPNLGREAITPLVDLADRYFPYRAFPGKAVRLFEELLAIHTESTREAGPKTQLTAADVYDSVSLRTGIPAFLLRDDRALKFDQVVRAFRRRIIGQRESIDRVAQTLCTVKAGLQPAGRPLANFLFVGPTGVGKTEVARTLAHFLFANEDRLARFDMSEYMDAWASERLIRGTDREEGLLTRRIRQQPFSVLLLDEIEKADSAVFDLLLQVMSDGRLTDAKGRTAFFHNAILIMTSNLGASHRRKALGFDDESSVASSKYYEEQVERHFRPEFVNRLDRVIAFDTLTPAEVGQIGRLAIHQLSERHGLADRGIRLEVADAVIEDLSAAAYDPAYGARQLHRHLDRHLVAPLSRLLSRLGQKAENTTLRITPRDEKTRSDELIDNGNLQFSVHRHASGKPRTALRGIEEIADMRREVHERSSGERMEEIREHLETLTTQLAQGRKLRKKHPTSSDIAHLQTEYHRLNQIQQRLDGLRGDLNDVEEVAISALFEGEPVEPFLEQAEVIYRQWRVALPYALVALESQRNRISLVVSELDRYRALDLWLTPLLGAASERGWTLTAHFHPDPDQGPSSESWGRQSWGKQHSAAELAKWLAAYDRGHGRVLLRISGPYAGIFMATEAGFHRYRNVPGCEQQEIHLRIERLAWRSQLTAKDLDQAADLLQVPPSSAGKIHPMRSYDFLTGQLSIADNLDTLGISYQEYWPRFDEIVCEHLMFYEEEPDRDRDDELLGARLKDEDTS